MNMGFGKRVPKRKTSCCASCTSPAGNKDDSPQHNAKIRKVHDEDHEQNFKESPRPRRLRRGVQQVRARIKDEDNWEEQQEEEEVSISPSEWLSDLSVLDSMNILDRPENEIFEILESHVTSFIPMNDVDSSDLLSLVGNNSLSHGIINKIVSLLNGAEGLNRFCFYFNYYLTDEKAVMQLIQNKGPLSQLIMFLDVDVDEEGEPYLAEFVDDSSSHFTLAVFDFESLTLMYADTLAWDIPSIFVKHLKDLLSSLDCPVIFHTILCHPPNDLDEHMCNESCSPLYPVQISNNLSGLAVIVCMVIASLQYDIFLSLVMGIQTPENLYFRYLQEFSNYSKFLRLMVGAWIVSDCVNFNYIACCDELLGYPSCDMNPHKFGEYRSTTTSDDFRKSSLEKGISVKTEPDLPVLKHLEEKQSSSFGLEEFIVCRPVVHFCKPNHFRLKLSLKDGRNLYKMFRCLGKNDRTSMRNIMEFLNSYKVIEWIKSKTFKSTANISSTRLRKNRTCNIIDFPDDIQEYFIKNPELSFERKIMYLVLRVYVRGCPSVMTKKFNCSAAGKNDRAAIRRINAYVKSKEFRELVISSARMEHKMTEEKLKYADFDDLVIKKPLIHHIKDRNVLKLECQLWTGKRVYRGFACSSAGKGDLKAMAAIKKFLGSKEATDWIRSKYEIKPKKQKNVMKKRKSPRDDFWLPCGELAVGLEVKNFFDAIEFDFRKRLVMAKGVTTLYEGNAIITENEKWGKTHRFDETYALDQTAVTEKGVFPAVTMYVTCSSKSHECKAQCGTHLKDFANTAIGAECPGCQILLDFPDKECINCLSSSTPKWYSINNELFCSACYQYQQKHNEARPSELNVKNMQAVSRLYHPHFACGWRLKLVIYSNNMSVWNLFKHKDNIKFHSTDIQETDRKPNISLLPKPPVSVANSPSKCQKVIIRSRDSKSILCNRCISENTSHPFVCTSQTELMKHISTAHKIALINCATCWSESGSLVNFENERQLQQHIQEIHKANPRFPSDRDQDPVEGSRQVELDEAVIALLEPSPM